MTLEVNPTHKDVETGLLHIMLEVETGEAFEQTIYLIAKTNSLSTVAVVPMEI